MSVRRSARLVASVALLAFAATAGTADARTIRVNWTDTQPLVGGRVVYRTTKIWLRGDRFAVDVTIMNRTKHDVKFFPATGLDDPAYIPRPGFGIAWRESASPNIHTRRLRTVVSRALSEKLPFLLRAEKTVNLTFVGRSALLRKHRTWWLTFGLAVPWKGKHPLKSTATTGGSYWISDKTFRS